jgi:hypothetical protein
LEFDEIFIWGFFFFFSLEGFGYGHMINFALVGKVLWFIHGVGGCMFWAFANMFLDCKDFAIIMWL